MFGHLDLRKYSSLPAWVFIVNFINLNCSYREDSESAWAPSDWAKLSIQNGHSR